MNNYEKLYWLTRLDSINGLFCIIGVISFISLLVYYIGMACSCFDKEDIKEYFEQFGKTIKIAYPLLVISLLITTFLPTKNEAILIVVGEKTLDFAQSDTSLAKIPAQTTKIILDYLDKELKQEKEEKK